MDFAEGVYLSEALAPPRFLFGMVKQLCTVGSESGQKQSVKLLQYMVSNTTQHLPPLPGHSSQSWVENTNMTDCISSL
jgi:hypothetical protein